MDIFKDMMIITNNSLVCDKFNKSRSVVFVDGGYMDVLRNVRDRIHKGSKLISHPLMGSVKPNETPYRTIIIRNSEENLDIDSLSIIEDSSKSMKSPFLVETSLSTENSVSMHFLSNPGCFTSIRSSRLVKKSDLKPCCSVASK